MGTTFGSHHILFPHQGCTPPPPHVTGNCSFFMGGRGSGGSNCLAKYPLSFLLSVVPSFHRSRLSPPPKIRIFFVKIKKILQNGLPTLFFFTRGVFPKICVIFNKKIHRSRLVPQGFFSKSRWAKFSNFFP